MTMMMMMTDGDGGAEQCGGRGGGRPDMAQAGGNQPQNLAAALDSVVPWVESRL